MEEWVVLAVKSNSHKQSGCALSATQQENSKRKPNVQFCCFMCMHHQYNHIPLARYKHTPMYWQHPSLLCTMHFHELLTFLQPLLQCLCIGCRLTGRLTLQSVQHNHSLAVQKTLPRHSADSHIQPTLHHHHHPTNLHIRTHLQVHPRHHPCFQLGTQPRPLLPPCLHICKIGIECNVDWWTTCSIPMCCNVLECTQGVKHRLALAPAAHKQAARGALW